MTRRIKSVTANLIGFAVLFFLGAVKMAQGQPEAWQIITSMDDVGWQAIHFLDSMNGFIASPSIQPYCLMRTRNGGYDWEGVIEWHSNFNPYQILFYDRMRGYLVSGARAGLTYDGGETWEERLLNQVIGGTIYIDSLRMISTTNQSMPEDSNIRRILLSFDGGRSWEETYEEIGDLEVGFGTPAISLSGTIVMGAGPNTLWRSTDQGTYWVVIEDLPVRYGRLFASPAAGVFVCAGFVLGLRPSIARSIDDGLTWETVWHDSTTLSYGFQDIEFVDSLHGWAVSDSLMVETNDGGETWTSYFIRGTRFGQNDLTFVNSSLGWAVDGGFAGVNIFRYNRPVSGTSREGMFPMTNSRVVRLSPNPFNESTAITYSVPTTGDVKVHIFSIEGKLIETIADNRVGPGVHSVYWRPRGLSSGMYLCRVNYNKTPLAVERVFLVK